jgi:signal transduction histidine kinase
MATLAPLEPSADLNLRILRHLVGYLREHYDTESVKNIAQAGNITFDELLTSSRWVSLDSFEAMLSAARALMPDDETFKNACAYKLADIPSHIRLCMGAVSPISGYVLGSKNLGQVTTISCFKTEVLGHGRACVRYETKRKESRLMCLSRQGQIEQVPTLWGMPPAHLTETRCVTRGDDACCYEVQVYEPRRWLPGLLGALAGAAAYFAWLMLVIGARRVDYSPLLSITCAVVGLLLGHLYEHRRTSASNRHIHAAINSAYIQSAREEANARRELFVLMQRQNSWGQLMETEVVERAQRLQDVAGELERLRGPRVVPLRGASEQFGSPLDNLQSTLRALRSKLRPDDADIAAAFDRLDADMDLLSLKLKEVGRTAASASDLLELMPQMLETWPLVDELRTRLRALVHLPDVRVSVFAAREAPERIRTDVALFNRVVDNLLMNAASHTERGSIIVEVSGTPGFLTIKVSDTGPGLSEDNLARVFRPLQRSVIGSSAGAGLSVVVQLLARMGGKLEVMSTPGRGATFWAHIPIDSEAVEEPTPTGKAHEEFLRRVVTVRSSHG